MKKHNLMRSIFFKINFLLFNLLLCTNGQIQAVTDWTVLIYVQANNNLYGFSLKNFSDMATIGSNENVTILVQWFQPEHKGIWRYKVEKGKLSLEECHPVEAHGTSAKDLVDAMEWATTKFPANKYSLILWDHGIGILDPIWGGYRPSQLADRLIEQNMVENNPRIQIPFLTTTESMIDTTITDTASIISHQFVNNSITFDTATKLADTVATNLDTMITATRGILFNDHSKTYMDGPTLAQALSEIKTRVLKNKKIDLLGMDACLMAMVEICYLARDYANMLVASQEVELAHGWNYLAIMQCLTDKNISPTTVAQKIVSTYETYYKDKIPFYTQSAINLEGMDKLKNNIDSVVAAYKVCQRIDANTIQKLALNARRHSVQFSSPGYIDLHSFYAELNKEISHISSSSLLMRGRTVETLKQAINNGMRIIEETVIASAVGKNLIRAKGLSIYFPLNNIDASYPKTFFAQDCAWYDFIKGLNKK